MIFGLIFKLYYKPRRLALAGISARRAAHIELLNHLPLQSAQDDLPEENSGRLQSQLRRIMVNGDNSPGILAW
jgi:hypothetical protein